MRISKGDMVTMYSCPHNQAACSQDAGKALKTGQVSPAGLYPPQHYWKAINTTGTAWSSAEQATSEDFSKIFLFHNNKSTVHLQTGTSSLGNFGDTMSSLCSQLDSPIACNQQNSMVCLTPSLQAAQYASATMLRRQPDIAHLTQGHMYSEVQKKARCCLAKMVICSTVICKAATETQ